LHELKTSADGAQQIRTTTNRTMKRAETTLSMREHRRTLDKRGGVIKRAGKHMMSEIQMPICRCQKADPLLRGTPAQELDLAKKEQDYDKCVKKILEGMERR